MFASGYQRQDVKKKIRVECMGLVVGACEVLGDGYNGLHLRCGVSVKTDIYLCKLS